LTRNFKFKWFPIQQKPGGGTGWVNPKRGRTPGQIMCVGLQRKGGARVNIWMWGWVAAWARG
jgi:hypothetical protein